MPDVSTELPSIGVENYFTFKEPFNTHFKTQFNLNSSNEKMKVVSIISMMDTITNDERDPYTNIYMPLDISEADFKVDINNGVSIISLKYTNKQGIEHHIRIPHNYIESIGDVFSIPYINKMLVMDFGYLPDTIDLTLQFDQIRNYVRQLYGVTPDMKEVSIGATNMVDIEESTMRENIRKNIVTVNKTDRIKYMELQNLYNDLLAQYLILKNT